MKKQIFNVKKDALKIWENPSDIHIAILFVKNSKVQKYAHVL